MEPKCLQTPGNIHSSLINDSKLNKTQLDRISSANDGISSGAIYNHIDLNNSIIRDNSVFKDDDSGSGSSEDTLRAHQNIIDHNLLNKDPENVGIYLETPVIDDSNMCLASHDYEKGNPKRLSDEFLSSDHIDDESLSLQTPSNNLNQNNSYDLHLTDDNASGNFLPISDSTIYLVEDDTNSYCSNLLDDKDESQFEKSSLSNTVVNINYDHNSTRNTLCNEYSMAGTSSVSSTCSIFDKNMQSMDAIERRDFEHEQHLTGGRIMRTKAMIGSDNKIKLEFVKAYQENNGSRAVSSDSKCTYKYNHHSTTPTSSRNNSSRLTKSTAKINLATSLNYVNNGLIEEQNGLEDINANGNSRMQQPCSSKSLRRDLDSSKLHLSEHPKVISLRAEGSSKHFEMFSSSNSNDSLSSEKSCSTSSNHSLPKCLNKPGCSGVGNSSSIDNININDTISNMKNEIPDDEDIKLVLVEVTKNDDNTVVMGIIPEQNASTSSSECCKYSTSHLCCRSAEHNDQLCDANRGYDASKLFVDQLKNLVKRNLNSNTSTSQRQVNICNDICRNLAASKCFDRSDHLRPIDDNVPLNNQLDVENNHRFGESDQANVLIALDADPNENDFDEETWGDCEDGSDEEKCTCVNINDNETIYGSREDTFDNFPLSDSDLSNCIQMVSLSEDMLIHDNNMLSPVNLHRKRKLNENGRLIDTSDILSPCSELSSGRKRLALDTTPKRNQMSVSSSPSTPYTRRLLIPTRENPPPELSNWLVQFQMWSNAERLLAVDRLIDHCEPTQVRHMMKVIEPQFQRDFISLLPKELALQVLSYLEPADLLRAAQTCRSWRFLCDDNLLWKEKCRKAQILIEPKTDRPKRGRAGNMPPISSLWKAAYMRQHIIEMNWRSRPIREPKILKGHDDHVITCLQFSGNRVVSGSDDNTLKVWSAVTGRCLRTLVGHTGGVWSSQMTGDIIVSGSTDRTLKVWHMDTGHCVHTLQGHTSTVRCMHLHGKKVVSGSRDATLRVWDIEMGTCLHVLVGHLAAVRCVQYDGRLIVSGAYDYTVKIWHPERQECLHTLQGHTNRVYSLQFDGIHVVSGSLDTSIRVWDAETGNCKHTLMGHQSLTSGMELRQNILVSGNADSTVKVWDITSGQCLQTLSGSNKHQSAVTCLQFNSRFVITSSDDGTVKLWDVKTGEFIRNLVALDSGGSGGVVWRIRANDTKLICAVGSRNGTEETKLMVLDFDVEGACVKCS